MKPLLRGHFHQAMFFIMMGAGGTLILHAESLRQKIAFSIYVFCALVMFGISSLYHRIYWSPEHRLTWKKLDHSGIFLMIAGSFTPVCMLALSESSGNFLLGTIWLTASVGILQSIFFVKVPKWVNSLIYVIAGFLVLPFMQEIYHSVGTAIVSLIIAGGLSYTIGAVCYALKRPNFSPKYFGYHEVFHIFVNLGAILQFLAIFNLVKK